MSFSAMKRTISFSMVMTCLFSANVCHGHIRKKDSIMPSLNVRNLFVIYFESHSISFSKPAAPPKKKSPRIRITGNISGKTMRHPRNIITSITPITINNFLLKVLISFQGFDVVKRATLRPPERVKSSIIGKLNRGQHLCCVSHQEFS